MFIKRKIILLLFAVGFSGMASAQTISKEELTFLTSEWKGERFPDGRPKVSDDLIARAKNIGIDDA
ncbi:MAG TPA: RraA family protein, partial [Mucilaginibacter sp.]